MDAAPDAIDVSRRLVLRERLGIATNEVVIVAPGMVHRRSGHRFAAWATAILKITELPVRLVIRHTGRAARDVSAFAKSTGFEDMVVLAGDDWSETDLLATADIAVFLDMDAAPPADPAMASGLPVIAGDTASNRNRLTDGLNALLVRPDRPREIARALLRLIEDKALAQRLGAAAKSPVRDAPNVFQS